MIAEAIVEVKKTKLQLNKLSNPKNPRTNRRLLGSYFNTHFRRNLNMTINLKGMVNYQEKRKAFIESVKMAIHRKTK